MLGYTHVRGLFLFGGLVMGLGSFPCHAVAQGAPRALEGPQFGIGYIASAPDLMGGIGGYVVVPTLGGIGIYLDAKFDLQNPSSSEEFESSLTAEQVPHEVVGANFIESESSYRSFNVAVVRPLNSFLMVYLGGGLAQRTRYNEYEDPSKTLGRGGIFWVEFPSEAENRMNMMIGMMMRVGPRITSHFGFETQPRGITVGISLRLPSW